MHFRFKISVSKLRKESQKARDVYFKENVKTCIILVWWVIKVFALFFVVR
jgi:hypothetical protein